MAIEELLPIVTKFRRAIEEADLSRQSIGEEASLRMQDFPSGACAEVTRILGIFLTTEHNVEPLVSKGGQIEKEEKWWGTHHWLEHDDIIIDITADQFPMNSEKVIVNNNSQFHIGYAQKRWKLECPFDLIHDPVWLVPLYKEVVRKYHSIE